MPSDLGERAQGTHLHPSVASGSILLSMGCGSFCHSHARSPRFREVLSNADGSRSALNLRSVCENHVVNSAFHDDVAKTRMFLNQSSHPKLFNHAMTDSICYANRILEEAFVPPGFHTSGYIFEISKLVIMSLEGFLRRANESSQPKSWTVPDCDEGARYNESGFCHGLECLKAVGIFLFHGKHIDGLNLHLRHCMSSEPDGPCHVTWKSGSFQRAGRGFPSL